MDDKGRALWDRMLAEGKARRERAEAIASANPRGIRFYARRDGTRRALASPDMAGDGAFRVTYFDQHGPSGQVCHNTLAEAVQSLLSDYEART